METIKQNKDNVSIPSTLGENYYYVKTIVNNKIEIVKLELLQQVASVSNIILMSIIAFFVLAIILMLIVVTLVVGVSQIVDSYLYALLLVNGGLIGVSIIMCLLFRSRIKRAIENRFINLILEEKPTL
jgi:uncharacterized membrane protein YqjE